MEFDGPLPAVTLTFWPNQYVLGTGTYMTQFLWKYSQRYCIHPVFRVICLWWPWSLTFDLWFQKLISTCTNPNTSVTKIGWNSLYWIVRYGVHKVFGSLPVVTLTLIHWFQKLISTMNPNTPVTKIGWDAIHWFLRYGVHKVFGSLFAVTIYIWPLIPKANQQICEPNYICDQNWMKFPSLIFEIWCSQGFRDAQTHALTYRWTDLNAVCLWHHFSMVAEAQKFSFSLLISLHKTQAFNRIAMCLCSCIEHILAWQLLVATDFRFAILSN